MLRDKVEDLIRELVSATQEMSLYGPRHNLTRAALDALYVKLGSALSGQDEITIGIIGNEVAFEKEPFYKVSRYIETFIAYLKEKKIEKVSFLKGATRDELEAFVSVITTSAKALGASGGLEKTAASKGLENIIFGKIGMPGEEAKKESGYASSSNKFGEGIRLLEETARKLSGNLPADIRAAATFIDGVIGGIPKNRDSFLLLTAVKRHDIYTFIHLVNVAIFTIVQADALGLRQEALTDIGLSGLLHDAGKLALSGDILRKKEKLTPEDVDKLRVHPIEGAKILICLEDLSPVIAIASFEHHVRYDMTGYPRKLYGGPCSLASMLVAISDMYDAMRSRRVYHEGAPPETVYEEMIKLSGGQFHPDLLDNFFRIVGVYPPGTLVELDDRSVGIVVGSSAQDIRRPMVEVLYNSAGRKEAKPYIIDLAARDEKTKTYGRTIVKSVASSDRYKIPSRYQ